MPKLLFVGIVERACRATIVREIPGISECFQVKDDKKKQVMVGNLQPFCAPLIVFPQLTTNGSNFRGMWEFASSGEDNIIEEDEIYSNDIYAILKNYGVEMCRAAILKEMAGIFAAYNIDVNRRHLDLIADYMVRHPIRDCKLLTVI